MQKIFRKTFFGFRPDEVKDEIERIDSEYEKKITSLQEEIEKGRSELKESEEELAELRGRQDELISKEREIAGVMLIAQQNAQKIEEEARERARQMLESSEEELRKKQDELEFLRLKVQRFREEFRDTLDKYRLSIETMKDPGDDTHFAPTLVTAEKDFNIAKKQDISS